MKDIFGKALMDYQNGNYSEDLVTWTHISDQDILPLPYLFRSYSEMPKLEQEALKLSTGKVLDVGCGAGNHSLWLQNKGLRVKAIDSSKGAVDVTTKRGVTQVEHISLLEENGTYDTILLLMNGSGIFQELSQLSKYLNHLKTLLKPNGQVLMDSSDIQYMYEDDDGGIWQDLNSRYYGELDYFISYKGETEVPMKWLYLDFDTLKTACLGVGLNCEKVMDGPHYDYLAKIQLDS